MICVLEVTAGPARGKRFWLRTNQQIEVGRISSADFAVPSDPHMSRRHLIVEGTPAAFRVRDVGSINGTFVNNAKVLTVELCTGDRIRAGETTFEVAVMEDDENPHAKDGFSFSRSLASDSDKASNLAANSYSLPVRAVESVFARSGQTDSDATQRVSIPPQLRTDGQASAANPTQKILDQAELADKHHSTNRTLLGNNSWWSDYNFRMSDTACLLDQQAAPSSDQLLLPKILARLEPDYTLTAIINVDQLGRYGRQILGVLVEQGVVTWHAPNICTIVDNRDRDFQRLAESALAQDAIIFLGGRTAFDIYWLNEFALEISRPSILNRRLRDATSDLCSSLLSRVEFAIFENGLHGRLSILLRDLIELSE